MHKEKESGMYKVARFIVQKRKAFLLLFVVGIIYSVICIPKVSVNYDITKYLPENTDTRRGLTLMEEEFTTFGTANVLVKNITYETAESINEELQAVDGVKMVEFDGSKDHYKDSAALYAVTLNESGETDANLAAMDAVREAVAPYDSYIATEIGNSLTNMIQKEMTLILIVAVVVIAVVLLFTSRSYMELPVFFLVFGSAAVLNMGTNYWFGEISFVTNSIAVVLQLALAIDYAIIYSHRFMDEMESKPPEEAAIAALSKAIPEIFSSSLTTISGLVALMLMQLKIGFDMGMVLSKGIVFSLLSVFLLMPGLVMLFNKPILKTRHKSLVPKLRFWGKAVVKTRFVIPVIFAVVLVGSFVLQSLCPYVFSEESLNSNKKTETAVASEQINEVFGGANMLAILVPAGDYEKEAQLLNLVGEEEMVSSAMGLANIPINDDYTLTSKLSPRQFSELSEMPVEVIRLLYQAYGLFHEEYAALSDVDQYKVPIIDMFSFLVEQQESGLIDLGGEAGDKIGELGGMLSEAKGQLQGEHYSRLVFSIDGPVEGEETFALLERVRADALQYYDDPILVGNSTNCYDLHASFQGDNLKISILTVLFVAAILLFTFQSTGLPILLVLTIQGSIWINFSFPFVTGQNVFFLAYLIVSAIQMGATIDYAIVITNRYMALKKQMPLNEAVIETISQCFPTVFTSGSILTTASFLIGGMFTEPMIASFGSLLGRGTLISILLVMIVLPQLLMLGDTIIEKTAFAVGGLKNYRQESNVAMNLDGRVQGYVSGYLDAEVKGVIRGDLNAAVEGKKGVSPESAPDGAAEGPNSSRQGEKPAESVSGEENTETGGDFRAEKLKEGPEGSSPNGKRPKGRNKKTEKEAAKE